MNKRIEKELIEQMNFEMYSAYVYMAMAAYFDSLDLKGCAHWMKMQTQEEMCHSMIMYNYLVDRGAEPTWSAIPEPKAKYDSVVDVFKASLHHEQEVTSRINSIMDSAIEESDHATRSFLNWYVDEQIEEESAVDDILKKLKLIGNAPEGLYMIDKELEARVFTAPAAFKL